MNMDKRLTTVEQKVCRSFAGAGISSDTARRTVKSDCFFQAQSNI